MNDYSKEEVKRELLSVKIKLVENARLQLVAVEHSPWQWIGCMKATLFQMCGPFVGVTKFPELKAT